MAKELPGQGAKGSYGPISSYTRKDMPGVTLSRIKGGPRARQVKKSKKFENTRKNNKEFGGLSTAAAYIRNSLVFMKPLSDYNTSAFLTALLRPLLLLDDLSPWGQRSVELSRNPGLLEGFQFNQKNVFELVFRHTIPIDFSKADTKATIHIPEVVPGINFFPVGTYPVYRWQAALVIAPDFYFNGFGKYATQVNYDQGLPGNAQTEWFPVTANQGPQTMELAASTRLMGLSSESKYTCVLALGIMFGTMAVGGPTPVNYAGAGKIAISR